MITFCFATSNKRELLHRRGFEKGQGVLFLSPSGSQIHNHVETNSTWGQKTFPQRERSFGLFHLLSYGTSRKDCRCLDGNITSRFKKFHSPPARRKRLSNATRQVSALFTTCAREGLMGWRTSLDRRRMTVGNGFNPHTIIGNSFAYGKRRPRIERVYSL